MLKLAFYRFQISNFFRRYASKSPGNITTGIAPKYEFAILMTCFVRYSGEVGQKGRQSVVVGVRGDDGGLGVDGTPGDDGKPGQQGRPGDVGPKGDEGTVGDIGEPGEPGPPGNAGQDGDDGDEGSFKMSVKL